MKSRKAQIKSKRKWVSGWARYITSRGVLRYHMVSGFNSVGGPKQLKLKHLRSGGNKFDSIMAILCKRYKQKTGKTKDNETEKLKRKPTSSSLLLSWLEYRIKETRWFVDMVACVLHLPSFDDGTFQVETKHSCDVYMFIWPLYMCPPCDIFHYIVHLNSVDCCGGTMCGYNVEEIVNFLCCFLAGDNG